MVFSPATGKVIHHRNCTYCIFRMSVKFKKKGRFVESEKCSLSLLPLPSERYCRNYAQIDCACDSCKNVALLYHM